MRGHNKIYQILLASFSLFLLGCASTHAPRNGLTSPTGAQADVYGGWIEVQLSQAKTGKSHLAGELIAISQDSIFIANESLHAVAQSELKSARLVTYQSNAGAMGGLVFLGTLSTISNGAFLLLTAPLWMIGGSIATGSRSFEPIIDYPKKDLSRFLPFARYPQGLPDGIDRSQIRMKPRG